MQLVQDFGWGKRGVLLLLMAFYIVLGCFMDSLSMILLYGTFRLPTVSAMQIDPIWFGILLVTVVELGLITPPIGMNLFVLRVVANLPLQTIVRGILPFILADILRLGILIAVPGVSLWLPSYMMT